MSSSSSMTRMTEETWQHRIFQRRKQINLGKLTTAYKTYRERVHKSARIQEYQQTLHPVTPRAGNRYLSKRAFDGCIRKWRRLLHAYDVIDAAGNAVGRVTEPCYDTDDDELASKLSVSELVFSTDSDSDCAE